GGQAVGVVECRRRPVQPEGRREWGLEARLAGLALERVEQRRLLATDIRPGANKGMEIEVDARAADVATEESSLIRLTQRFLEARHRLAQEIAPHVGVTHSRI